MTYYEQLLEKKGLKLTDEQQSVRNAWFVSQNDQTRRYKPLKKLSNKQGYITPVHKQTDHEKMASKVGTLFH